MSFRLYLDPADTLAIGDGRPFNQDDAGRAVARSLFPPPPDTLYGAARVACARALGWDGSTPWPKAITDVLGSWTETRHFAIGGPFFRLEEGGDLLPIPAHVVANPDGDLVRLRPSDEPFETERGSMRLPVPSSGPDVGLVSLAGRYGRADAVRRLLSGENVGLDELGAPEAVPAADAAPLFCNARRPLPGWGPDDLAAQEPRVGIARDNTSGKVIEGRLYASVRRQVRPGTEMFVKVRGLGNPFKQEVAVRIGGEARFGFAHADTEAEGPPPADPPARYLICLTTPAAMAPPAPGASVGAFPGTLVSAVIPTVVVHNGRPGDAKGHGRTVLPAGSVLFMEGGRKGMLPPRIGDETHLGYGCYEIGAWT